MSITTLHKLTCHHKALYNFLYYRSVPQICPPFCNLSLSTKRRGGLYAGCDNFSRNYALPSRHEVNIVGGGWGPSVGRRRVRSGETLAVGSLISRLYLSGRLTNFSVEERGSRALPRSSWRVHCCAGGPCSL